MLGIADQLYRSNQAWWVENQDFGRTRRQSVRHHFRSFHREQSAALFSGLLSLLDLCNRITAYGARLATLRQDGAGSARGEGLAELETLLGRLGARPIGPLDMPAVYELFQALSRRAGLRPAPRLYWIPAAAMNAFAVGRPGNSAVAVTDGLLRNLTIEELVGILAHELAHIRNGDANTMAIADDCTTAIELASLTGLSLLALDRRGTEVRAGIASAELAILLRGAPMISRLLQSALSRVRELEADLDAAELAGGVSGLVRAIAKLERHHAATGATTGETTRASIDTLFRSHPETPSRMHSLFAIG